VPQYTPERAHQLAERWRREPERSKSARLGAAMLAGQWTTRADAGGANTLLSQTVNTLRVAGYDVEKEHIGNNQYRYRVAGSSRPARPPERAPALGAVLTVRALAMADDGSLTMHLTNGAGAWAVTVDGYVS
jgi:hypothetical protein